MVENTYQGSGSLEHSQEYLDEFVLRFNRHRTRHSGLVFMRLLQRAVTVELTIYHDLVRVFLGRSPRDPRTRPEVNGPSIRHHLTGPNA